MLVLSRRLGEKIFIGDNVVITVCDIDRGKIRLGIECPRDIPIYRQELLPIDRPPVVSNAAALAEYAVRVNLYGVDSPEAEVFRANHAGNKELSELMAISRTLKQAFIADGRCQDGPALDGGAAG